MNYFIGEWFADLCILQSYLNEIDFYSGTERKQMLKKENIKHPKDGGSMLYGLTWKSYLSPTKNRTPSEYVNLCYTKCYDLYPTLKFIIAEFAFIYFKDFDYDSLQLNKNYKCPKHIDSKNVGESILISTGDYEGGETIIYYKNKECIVDSRDKYCKFNGSKYYHKVNDYKGTRYSIVFFNLYPNKKLRNTGMIL